MGNYNKAELDVGAAIDYVYGKFCFASALKRRWKVSDFKITSKVQNGRLLKKIESCGYASVAEFCRETGAPLYEVHNYINFRIAPIKNDGSFRRSVHGICASLDCLPEDIFSDEQMWMQVEKNYTEQYFREHEVFEALSGVDDSLHIEADRSDLERAVGNALSQLTDRERNIIAMRFGISGHGELTLEKVACHFGGS